MTIREAVDSLDKLIAENPKKMFNWTSKTPNGIEWMFGVTYEEWMGWNRKRKLSFVKGLKKFGVKGFRS
jgi:hypothetical protein